MIAKVLMPMVLAFLAFQLDAKPLPVSLSAQGTDIEFTEVVTDKVDNDTCQVVFQSRERDANREKSFERGSTQLAKAKKAVLEVIRSEELQTSRLSVRPIYGEAKNNQPAPIIAWETSAYLTLKTTDLGNLGKALEAATQSVQVVNLRYSVSDALASQTKNALQSQLLRLITERLAQIAKDLNVPPSKAKLTAITFEDDFESQSMQRNDFAVAKLAAARFDAESLEAGVSSLRLSARVRAKVAIK